MFLLMKPKAHLQLILLPLIEKYGVSMLIILPDSHLPHVTLNCHPFPLQLSLPPLSDISISLSQMELCWSRELTQLKQRNLMIGKMFAAYGRKMTFENSFIRLMN